VALRFHNEVSTYQISRKRLHHQWIKRFIRMLEKDTGEICIILTSNSQLLQMNRDYLQHNYFTDVITFDYTDGNVLSGDIFISVEKVQENAGDYGVSVAEELRRVMIHGVLHLAGFGDATAEEKNIMRKMENDALNLWSKMEDIDAGV